MRRFSASFAFVALGVALVACGGGESRPAPATATAVAPGGSDPYVMPSASASAAATPSASVAPVASSAAPAEPAVEGPKVGEVAPPLVATASNGAKIDLAKLKGKLVVVYFYPKDDTPGCTAEACSFRDHESEITRSGAVILGVSTDSLESHDKFKGKYNLNFPLLSDTTSDVAKMYGVWKEKNLYGRRTWGVARTTFWIGPDLRIRKIWKKVDTAKHGEEILGELNAAHAK